MIQELGYGFGGNNSALPVHELMGRVCDFDRCGFLFGQLGNFNIKWICRNFQTHHCLELGSSCFS